MSLWFSILLLLCSFFPPPHPLYWRFSKVQEEHVFSFPFCGIWQNGLNLPQIPHQSWNNYVSESSFVILVYNRSHRVSKTSLLGLSLLLNHFNLRTYVSFFSLLIPFCWLNFLKSSSSFSFHFYIYAARFYWGLSWNPFKLLMLDLFFHMLVTVDFKQITFNLTQWCYYLIHCHTAFCTIPFILLFFVLSSLGCSLLPSEASNGCADALWNHRNSSMWEEGRWFTGPWISSSKKPNEFAF